MSQTANATFIDSVTPRGHNQQVRLESRGPNAIISLKKKQNKKIPLSFFPTVFKKPSGSEVKPASEKTFLSKRSASFRPEGICGGGGGGGSEEEEEEKERVKEMKSFPVWSDVSLAAAAPPLAAVVRCY